MIIFLHCVRVLRSLAQPSRSRSPTPNLHKVTKNRISHAIPPSSLAQVSKNGAALHRRHSSPMRPGFAKADCKRAGRIDLRARKSAFPSSRPRALTRIRPPHPGDRCSCSFSSLAARGLRNHPGFPPSPTPHPHPFPGIAKGANPQVGRNSSRCSKPV